jgi:2-methylcitrate dehydratase PrpD
MNETKRLAEFCAGLHYEDLSRDVVEHTKNLVLDAMGYTLGGAVLEHSQIIMDYLLSVYCPQDRGGTVLGFGHKLPLPEAVLMNGSMAHGPELDDCDNVSSVHPGAAIMPAALTTAEALHAPGSALILGAVLGYEVMMRLGAAAGSGAQYERGFHPTGTTCSFGASATVGALYKADAEQMARAFGIAGSLAAGSMEYLANGAWTKRLHPGAGGRNGLLSVELARRGYTGPTTILEGKHGFLTGHTDRRYPELLVDGFGKEYKITQVSVKPYACCRDIHQALTALFDLMKTTPIDPGQVERIDAEIARPAMRIVGDPQEQKRFPVSAVDAQFSLNYCLAVGIIRKNVFVDEFKPDVMGDPVVRDLTARTFVTANPDLDKEYPKYHPARVVITMRDGHKLSCYSKPAKGDPELPLTRQEYEVKFRLLATPVIGKERVEEVIRVVAKLEEIPDVSVIPPLLMAPGGLKIKLPA